MALAFLANLERQKKNVFHIREGLQLDIYKSVQHRLQFSGIKRGQKFHFIGTLRVELLNLPGKKA